MTNGAAFFASHKRSAKGVGVGRAIGLHAFETLPFVMGSGRVGFVYIAASWDSRKASASSSESRARISVMYDSGKER